jgi:hypothetical protein
MEVQFEVKIANSQVAELEEEIGEDLEWQNLAAYRNCFINPMCKIFEKRCPPFRDV